MALRKAFEVFHNYKRINFEKSELNGLVSKEKVNTSTND